VTTAVRQTVTVKADGRLEVVAAELRAGTVTEVIVLLPADAVPPPSTVADRLAALHRLQQRMDLSSEDVERWQQQARDERHAHRLPGDADP
jgi:hypothetical protein